MPIGIWQSLVRRLHAPPQGLFADKLPGFDQTFPKSLFAACHDLRRLSSQAILLTAWELAIFFPKVIDR